MKRRPALPPPPYLVAGLRLAGSAAALALHERGETVIGADTGAPAQVDALRTAGIDVHVGADGADLVPRVRTLVKSPGVPPGAPVVRAAVQRGLPVIDETELGWRLVENEVIAVTGTNGKTTTTEWIGHLHRTAGAPVAVGGNTGVALSSFAGRIAPEVTVVCEVAAFQLEASPCFAPEAAVIGNLSEDHLDRYGTFERYVAAKRGAFANQAAEDVAVLPDDLGVEMGGAGRRVLFGAGPDAALADRDGALWWAGERLIAHADIALPGAHNRRNAAAAAAACLARGLDAGAVAAGLGDFSGVAHRLELVTRRGGVDWVNDSKATNVASTLVALDCFPGGGLHLILGGRPKGGGYAPLRDPVAARCRAVYAIGEAAGEVCHDLGATGVPVRDCGDLERAVAAARGAARPGETVLLSPACASYDQYANFEQRGEHFTRLARADA
jgi:UDP-N-acetylmuramoylalanine--D-glutamate ligase